MTAPINYNPAATGCHVEHGRVSSARCPATGTPCIACRGGTRSDTAVELVRDGWPDTAMSYVRWSE